MGLEKQLDDLSEADLAALVTDRYAESRMVDYKRELHGSADGMVKEFLADVSSFANALGGHLLYGIEEEAGEPTKVTGLDLPNTENEVLRLETSIRDGIVPRIPSVKVWPVKLSSGKTVIVIHVPRSYAAPHMVAFKSSSRFYARGSKGKYQMDIQEIRSAFLMEEGVADKVTAFHSERLNKIGTHDCPVALGSARALLVHTLPLAAFRRFRNSGLATVVRQKAQGLLRNGELYSQTAGRPNIDGYVVHRKERGGQIVWYEQLFLHGAIETVDTSFMGPDNWCKGRAVEQDLVQTVSRHLRVLRELQVDPPFVVMVSMRWVRGCRVVQQEGDEILNPPQETIDRDDVHLVETFVENLDCLGEVGSRVPCPSETPALPSVGTLLRDAIDSFWNAAGWPSSPYYRNGKWVGCP